MIALHCMQDTNAPSDQGRPGGVFAPLLRTIAEKLERAPLGRLRAAVEEMRIRAGEPSGLDANGHLARTVLCGAAGLLAIAPFAGSLGIVGSGAVFLSVAACPLIRLSGQARRRLRGVDRSLAHANDLLVLSLEAGLDLVGAIRQCVAKARAEHDPLAAELRRVLRDLELGSTRRAAMEAMARRAPTDAIKGFVSAVVQAEQRGTPLAQALRIQAVALRTARSQRIEARAGRAAVLVLLPLILIFAATVLLVFGGVVVRAMRGELL